MTFIRSSVGRSTAALAALAAAGLLSTPVASAGSLDSDGDGMPNRWEVAHNLDAHRANARADADHDGLRNIGEFRNEAKPHDEDSDNDGDDDGDEVHDGSSATNPHENDTDDDGVLDGDEDADHDGSADEDDDDADEDACGSAQDDEDDDDADEVEDHTDED